MLSCSSGGAWWWCQQYMAVFVIACMRCMLWCCYFNVNTSSLGASQLVVSSKTGDITSISTSQGFVTRSSSAYAARSFIRQHGSAAASTSDGTIHSVIVRRCDGTTASSGAICVSRNVTVNEEHPASGVRNVVMSDRYEAASDGSVRWTVEVQASRPDPFRAVIGTAASVGNADSYWVPRAFSAGAGSAPPSPFPQPSLVNCSSSEERDAAADTLWVLNGTERPTGSVFSVGASKCLLTWAPSFTPTSCVGEPNELAVLYPCGGIKKRPPGPRDSGQLDDTAPVEITGISGKSGLPPGSRRAGASKARVGACPGDGNQLWELDTRGRLVNVGVRHSTESTSLASCSTVPLRMS